VNVYDTGVNLLGGLSLAQEFIGAVGYSLDTTNKTVTYTRSKGIWHPKIKFKENTQYTFVFTYSGGRNNCLQINYTNGEVVQVDLAQNANKTTYTLTTSANKTIKDFGMGWKIDNQITIYYDESGIFEGAITADDFVAYTATTYTTALKDANDQPLTCYGGQLENVNGVQTLTVTHANIASYNGETINEPWISSMDVYSEGATPTTGAQVVYPLTTPTQIPQQSQAISTQDGTNNIWADTGDIEVKCLDRIIPTGV
jgi:hypothetical protein